MITVHMARPVYVGIALLLLVISACETPDDSPSAVVERVPIPEDRYAGVAWLGDGSIFVTAERRTAAGRHVVELFRGRGDDVELIEIEPIPDCRVEGIRNIGTLPDGRLGFAVDCDVVDAPFTPTSIRALDLPRAKSEELARVPSGVFRSSFTPDMRRLLVAATSGICASIAEIVNGEVVDTGIVVGEGSERFAISDGMLDQPERCTEYGRADMPAWSPDGDTFAFFGSPSSIGRDGTARLDAPWNLYLLGTGENSAEPTLTGIDSAYDLAWSPDGRWLAFTADRFNGQSGTWVYAPETEELIYLMDELLFSLTWAPDASQLAGLLESAELDGPRDVVTVRIASGEAE